MQSRRIDGNKNKGLAGSKPPPSLTRLQNQCADNSFRQTSVCFNLALHLHFADTPRIYATTPLQARQTTKRKSDRKLVTKRNTSAIEVHHEHKAHDSDA